MNPDALSDLVLLGACGWILARTLKARPSIAVAAVLFGVAALVGVLRFSGFDMLSGVHKFTSLLAACAAFPLLAYALSWPQDPTSVRLSAAARFAMLFGGVGVAIVAVGFKPWGQIVPILSGLLIAWTMLRLRSVPGLLGVIALFASFGIAVGMDATTLVGGLFNRVQLLHYSLALALVLLTLRPTKSQAVSSR